MALLFRITRVSWYQKQSDTLTPATITILHCTSNHTLHVPSTTSFMFSLVSLYTKHLQPQSPYISSPTHCHPFLTHVHTISIYCLCVICIDLNSKLRAFYSAILC